MTGGGFGPPGGGGKTDNVFEVLRLKNASAEDVAAALQKAFPTANLRAVAEKQSNAVIIVSVDPAAMKDILKLVEQLDAKPGALPDPRPGPPGMGGGPRATGGPTGPIGTPTPIPGKGPMQPGEFLNVITLKNATAEETAVLLKKLFPVGEFAADARTNSLVVRGDEKTLEEVRALVTRLDTIESPKKPR